MSGVLELTRDALETTVQGIVADVIKDEFGEFQEAVEELSKGRTRFTPPSDEERRSAAEARVGKEAGLIVGGIVRCIALGKGMGGTQAAAAKLYPDEEHPVRKALSLGDETAGGFLVPTVYSAEIIELLYAASIVTSFGPRFADITEGELHMSRMATGASFSWGTEGANIDVSQQSFDALKLMKKRGQMLVPISNDLLNTRSGSRTDQLVRDDLVAGSAQGIDVAYIRGAGTESAPKGLLLRGVQTSANGTVNLANVTADLVNAIKRMMDAKIPMTNLGWMFGTSPWAGLYSARDGNGNFAFKPEMDRGTLFSFPFKVSPQIPSGAAGEVYLTDFDQVVIGEAGGIELAASTDASYNDGADKHAFQRYETLIRAIIYTDIILRHSDGCQILTSANWGSIPAS